MGFSRAFATEQDASVGMRQFALILLLWPGIWAMEEFGVLTGDEILQVPTGRKLDGGRGVCRSFDDTKLILYFAARLSEG